MGSPCQHVEIRAFFPLNDGDKVTNMGWGRGFIVKHLPANTSYCGFDTDWRNISYKARFYWRIFDESAAEYGPADVVMMNGVLHHLSDDQADSTLRAIETVLRTGGQLSTLDGYIVEHPSASIRFLLDHDRGRHGRTREQYEALVNSHFTGTEAYLLHRLTWVHNSSLVVVCQSNSMTGRK